MAILIIAIILAGMLVLLGLGWIAIAIMEKKMEGLPPGPLPLPFIGNLHVVGRLPHRNGQHLAKKYGPILYLRLGSLSNVVVSSSEAAMEILKTNDSVMASRPATIAGKYLAYDSKDIVAAPYGPYWWRMRKLCVHHLLSPTALRSFRSIRQEETSSIIISIYHQSVNSEDAEEPVVNLSKRMASMITNILCRMAVGRAYSDDSVESRTFRDIIHEIFFLTGAINIGDCIPCLEWMDVQGYRHRQKKVHRAFDAFAEKIIEDHSHASKDRPLNADFVDILLAESQEKGMEVTRENIKAIILDMVVAGTDTTLAALDWAMSELLRNPSVMRKAQEELDAVVGSKRDVEERDLPFLEYLQCVVKETLRLYPSLPLMIPHQSMESCTVSGYRIPAKTWVFVNAWAIGRDPKVWDEAEKFKPERFLGRSVDVRGVDFEWIPFGSGRRGCPGSDLAMVVVQLALARLLHSFDWSIPHGGKGEELDMRESYKFTLSRTVDLLAVPTPRCNLIFI